MTPTRPPGQLTRSDATRKRERYRYLPKSAVLYFLKTATLVGLVGFQVSRAQGQVITDYFPVIVPGYDQELGVTVLSRVRPLYQAEGMRAGSFIVGGGLDESFGYNSNLLGLRSSRNDWLVETAPSISVNSNWSRNRLGASLSVDNIHYFNQPDQSLTNFTAALGGGYTIGRGDLTLAYAHLDQHQMPTEVGASATSTPVPYTVDNVRSQYIFNLDRLKITPSVEYSFYRFGESSVLGTPTDFSFRNRDVLAGGVTAGYDLAEQRTVLVVLRGFDSQFVHNFAGSPSQSSRSGLFLGGIDYQYDGVWRYRVLAGLELRSFESSQFQTRIAAVGQGEVVWTPTNLLTLTGRVSRTIEDPSEEASSGFTYTAVKLVADYEFSRNILLEGRAGLTFADNLQGGGTQTRYDGGAQITWLLNRNLSATASYAHVNQTGAIVANSVGNSNLLTTGAFTQDIVIFGLHVHL